jgi:hypothetical protein
MKSQAQSQVNGFIETIRKPISLNSCHSNAKGGQPICVEFMEKVYTHYANDQRD